MSLQFKSTHSNLSVSNRNDPFKVVHPEYDRMAAQFDPSLKVNRFRSIAGNENCRVSLSNYSIIRVSSEDELEAWRNAPLPAGGDQGRYDLVRHNVVYLRDDLDVVGKSGFESELLQDGFGITFGSPLFLGNPEACREVGL